MLDELPPADARGAGNRPGGLEIRVGRSLRHLLLILLPLAVVAIAACTVRFELASPRAVTGDLAAVSTGLAGPGQRLFEIPAEAAPPPAAGVEVARLASGASGIQLWPAAGGRPRRTDHVDEDRDGPDPLRPQVRDAPAPSAPADLERTRPAPGAPAPAIAALPPRAARAPAMAAMLTPRVILPPPPRPSSIGPAVPATVLAVLPPPAKPTWVLALDERPRRTGSGGAGRRRGDPQLVLAPGLELALPQQRYDLAWLRALSGRPDLTPARGRPAHPSGAGT